MGVGYRKLVNITRPTEQMGSDSLEPIVEVTKQVYAELKELSVSNGFTGQQAVTNRGYEFLIDYDSQLSIDFGNGVEYDNKQFVIKAIDRCHRISTDNKYSYRVQPAEDGNYYRLLCESESYG